MFGKARAWQSDDWMVQLCHIGVGLTLGLKHQPARYTLSVAKS